MSSSAVLTSVRRLRCLMAGQHGQEKSDEQLLTAFTDRRDDIAFAALMRRHGPMVLGVCRRVLGHEQDAEDAFQATFLVLARRAATLRRKTALVSFLHSTACHVAAKVKRAAGRRRKYEGSLGALTRPRSPANPTDELSWREVRTCLDEEIARLPEIYRSAFILCCLESASRAEAARRLGVREGTLSSRLAEARKRLGQRLARRGVELTAVLAAIALATPTASAVPPALMASTVKAALATAAGEALTGIASTPVAGLVTSATKSMMLSKAKIAALVLLLVATSGSLVGWFGRASGPLAAAPEPPAAKADDKPKTAPPPPKAVKTVEIQGRVFDPDGKPKAGAKILLLEKSQQLGVAGAEGRFRIALPKETKEGTLIAQAEGFGIDFIDFSNRDPKKSIEFRLVKDRPIRGRIVTTEGKPAAGARLSVKSLGVYANNSMDSFLTAWKKRHFMSGIPGGVKSIWDALDKMFATTTDAEGRFVLRGLGEERLVTLRLKGTRLADDELWIVSRGGFDPSPYNQATLDNIPKGQENLSNRWILHGPDLDAVAEAEKVLRGLVKDADTGKGRPGVLVQMTRRDGGALMRVIPQTRTDAQGRYELRGARKTKSYMLEVSGDPEAGYMPRQVWANDTAGYEPITADIPVKKGVIVTGKMLDGKSGKPVPGHVMIAVLQNNPFAKDYPSFDGSAWFPMKQTRADGSFRVVAIPGHVLLMGGPNDWTASSKYKPPKPDPKYPHYFDTRIPDFPSYYTSGGGISPIQGVWCKVLDIKKDAKLIEHDIVLERASVLTVRIQDAEGKPLTDVWIAGNTFQEWYPPNQCKQAECAVYQIEPGKPRLIVFYHAGRKLAGTLTLKGDEKPPVVVKLSAAGTIKGQLLDTDGNPLAGVAVDVHYRQRVAAEVHNAIHHAKQIVTDANGVFSVDDLIPQQKFELAFHRGKRKFEKTPKLVNPAIEIKTGEIRDMGALKVKRVVEKPGE